MLDPATRQILQQEAGQRASAKKLTPYLVAKEDIKAWKQGNSFPLPFPFIGDYDPPQFEARGDALFVDITGFGLDSEPALTLEQLVNRLEPDVAYAFTSHGQFQAHLQPFISNVGKRNVA